MRPRYETEGDADAINSKGVTWTGVRGGCEGEMLPKEEGEAMRGWTVNQVYAANLYH